MRLLILALFVCFPVRLQADPCVIDKVWNDTGMSGIWFAGDVMDFLYPNSTGYIQVTPARNWQLNFAVGPFSTPGFLSVQAQGDSLHIFIAPDTDAKPSTWGILKDRYK